MCCCSQKTIKCCSKCLCFTSLVLFLAMSAIALLGVMVSKREFFEQISLEGDLVDDVDFIDLAKGSNMVISCTLIAICLTCLAVLFTWLTKLTMSKSICCTIFTCIIFFVLCVGFMIIGSVLVVPGTVGDKFIEQNCKLVREEKMDEMNIFFKEIFSSIKEMDTKLSNAVNTHMCTDQCKCLNDDNKTIKKIYDQYDEEVFKSYKRTKGPIDSNDGYENLKALKFQISQKDKGYETMLACYKDIEAKKRLYKGNEDELNKLDSVQQAKLSPNMQRLITFLEGQYECSGICQPTFFYYTLPLTKGKPQQGCLQPINKGIGEDLLYFGIIFQATSLIFLFMLICTCPLCCFDNELAIKEAAAEKDIEFARRQQQDNYDFSDFANAPAPRNGAQVY